MTSFSRQKPLNSKNKKHRIFWNTEFYHPAKFELKRIKNAKVVTTLQLFAFVLARREDFRSGLLETEVTMSINQSINLFTSICGIGVAPIIRARGSFIKRVKIKILS